MRQFSNNKRISHFSVCLSVCLCSLLFLHFAVHNKIQLHTLWHKFITNLHNWGRGEKQILLLPMIQRSEEGKRDLRERERSVEASKQTAREHKTNKNKKPCSESTVRLLLLLSSFKSFFFFHLLSSIKSTRENIINYNSFVFFTSQDHKDYEPPNSLYTLWRRESLSVLPSPHLSIAFKQLGFSFFLFFSFFFG